MTNANFFSFLFTNTPKASGVVTAVGDDVEHLKVGDRVCMEPGIPNPHRHDTIFN